METCVAVYECWSHHQFVFVFHPLLFITSLSDINVKFGTDNILLSMFGQDAIALVFVVVVMQFLSSWVASLIHDLQENP